MSYEIVVAIGIVGNVTRCRFPTHSQNEEEARLVIPLCKAGALGDELRPYLFAAE